MSHTTKLQEQNLSNYFLFSLVMEDEILAREMLNRILGQSLPRLEVMTEKQEQIHPHVRYIRLDVRASLGNIRWNIEMENEGRDLAKRSRYHQSVEDVKSLGPGMRFGDLGEGYVIFICTFDPFGKGKYYYEFCNTEQELKFPLGDQTKKIFLSTKGKDKESISAELLNFLEYVEESTDEVAQKHKDDWYIQALHKKLTTIRNNSIREVEWMMTVGELLDCKMEETEQRVCRLFLEMMQENRSQAELTRIVEDKEYRHKMYMKYKLVDDEKSA